MKILKIKCSGFKLLKDNFEISFDAGKGNKLPNNDNELLKEGDHCFFNALSILIGMNCSGKTTVLELIELCNLLIENGRIPYQKEMFGKDKIDLEILFVVDNTLYKYSCVIKYSPEHVSFNNNYCLLLNQKLSSKNLYRVNDIYDQRRSFTPVNINNPKDLDSYCIIKYLNFRPRICLSIEKPATNIYQLIRKFLKMAPYIGDETLVTILNLFGYDVETIKLINEDYVEATLENGDSIYKPIAEIVEYVTVGSMRGALTYAYALLAIKLGATLIADEIDACLNKQIVEEIVSMFFNKSVNKKQASIVYSTHNPSLLDLTNKTNNINIVHKNTNGKIEIVPFTAFCPTRLRVAQSKIYKESSFYVSPKEQYLKKINQIALKFNNK